ncbi:uncharacterized protein LOC110622723 isoform X3 [Manihot esculenta]|uniref:Uncharacterized protein n=1 Tax=Manihot esculenta TaxID=3983 RepID=A0ACB7H7H7_MANES|nr:uncharacterized protein LOC110622723 isoform X3 [Manihot esculenta]KAG8646856.1 hypothetical protein MANES_09G036200v8 [Manihot esculenta]
MRIRKRQVPFPLSSLSPLPLSDPHFSRSPVVQLQLNTNPLQNLPQQDQKPAFFDPQSVHQPNQPIGGGSNPQACSDGSATQEVKDFQKDKRGGGGGGGVGRSDNTRRGDFLGAESETVVHQLSNPSHQEVGRWCEGEKAFPLKKRRGNFERSKEEETTVMKDKKMKTKMNKKCLQRNANTEAADKEDKETKEGINGKKRIRGGALMEGSRCSRVNGRGWRCCQQTLVGYSLCEHHLGKGRLRSMTSVRSRAMASSSSTSKKAISSQPLPSTSLSSEDKEQKHPLADNKLDDEGDDKKKPLMISKKKMKLGIVKARSISSLLGEANHANIAVAEKRLNTESESFHVVV